MQCVLGLVTMEAVSARRGESGSLELSRTPWPKAAFTAKGTLWVVRPFTVTSRQNLKNFIYRKFCQLLQWFHQRTMFERNLYRQKEGAM